jgi:CRP-like cAMP-binding protein
MYETINFFKEKDESFIGWIATILKTNRFEEKEYVYKEGEECGEIYFILKGQIGYVLPRFGNISFKLFE